MRHRVTYGWFALLALGIIAGCDSGGDDEVTDAERFVGTWEVVGVTDAGQDRTADFLAAGSMRITFQGSEEYVLVYDAADDAGDAQYQGPFALNDALNRIELTATVLQGVSAELPFTYDFQNDDRIVLRPEAEAATVISIVLTGAGVVVSNDLALTLERQ